MRPLRWPMAVGAATLVLTLAPLTPLAAPPAGFGHGTPFALGAAGAAITPPGCEAGAGEADTPDRARTAITSAPVVFTGKVVATRDQAREAEIQVERVWKGGPLPRSVIIQGTYSEKKGVFTALDRTYHRGETYLFMPPRGTSPRFIENACAPSVPLTQQLAALAPADGGQPPQGSGASFGGIDKAIPLFVGVGGAVGLAALALVLRRWVRAHRPVPR